MARQYVSVAFRTGGQTYLYHNDGDPVAAGDRVTIAGKRGPQTCTVDHVMDDEPPFETKPIAGIVGEVPPPVEGVMTTDLFGKAGG